MFRKSVSALLLFLCFALTVLLTNHVQATPPETAYIDVAVATLWVKPDTARELDQPALANPVDMRQWTGSMELIDKMWLVRNLETQALYGQKVFILEERGNWVKVAVEGQPTPREVSGYPGWLPKTQLTFSSEYANYAGKPFIIVKAPTTWLYHTQNTGDPFMEISFNTVLPVLQQAGDWVAVATPEDGSKWLLASSGALYASKSSIPLPTPEDLLTTARQFIGLPYLWAGISGFGFDCSGFTHSLHKFYGITIPRDSSAQAVAGEPVAREDLRPGDLIFFAYNNGKGRVHHVAMYAGDGQIIHSPKSERSVEIIPLTHPDYVHEYAGARRYIP